MCPFFTNPPDWLKTLANGVKTRLLNLKASNRLARVGEIKIFPGEWGGMNKMHNIYLQMEKRVSPFLIFNFNK